MDLDGLREWISSLTIDEVALIVSASAAAFTAVAAIAAWRAAAIAAHEARERTKPYVAMGIPRVDVDLDAHIVPLKNLGLGPARLIALQLKDAEGNVISARLGPGLAPMEADEWAMLLVGWDKLDPPSVTETAMEGVAEDAAGRRHPIHIFASAPLPFPSHDVADVYDDADLERAGRGGAARRPLKMIARAIRDGEDPVVQWALFWNHMREQGIERPEFEQEVRELWSAFGLDDEIFLRPDDFAEM